MATKKNAKKATETETPETPAEAPTVINEATENKVKVLDRSAIKVDHAQNARNFGKPVDPDEPEIIELAQSIGDQGLLEPLIVEPLGEGEYGLIAGFRRITACDLAKLGRIPCTIKEPANNVERRLLNAIENCQREDLTPAELAWTLKAMKVEAKDAGQKLTNDDMANMIHKSKAHVGNLIRCAENLIAPIAKAFRGEAGLSMRLEDAVRFAGMSKDDQRTAWEAYMDRIKARGEGGGDSKGKRDDGKKKMPRREKIEELFDDLGVAEEIKIAGQWVKFSQVHHDGARAALRWVLGMTSSAVVRPTRAEIRAAKEQEDDE
jgi:ParB/RepB/Spo0J family partition protein